MDGDVVLTGSVPSYRSTSKRPRWRLALPASDSVHSHPQVALPHGDHGDDLTLAVMARDALTLGGAVPEGVEATAKDQIRDLEQQ